MPNGRSQNAPANTIHRIVVNELRVQKFPGEPEGRQHETFDNYLVFPFTCLFPGSTCTCRRQARSTQCIADHVRRPEHGFEWIRPSSVQDSRAGSASKTGREFSENVLPIPDLRRVTFVVDERPLSLQHGRSGEYD